MSQTTDEGRDAAALTPTHVVACYTCKASFDAVSVGWCQCLVTRRSLVCPVCRNCFCKAPQSYKQDFWQRAPQQLWDRAEAEHRPGKDLPENPDAEMVGHPVVLIVDDEKGIRRMAFAAVTGLGYHAVVASDGEEGIELVARYRPELVLTDAFMPKLDGREMCRRIKANPETASTKVIIITSVYTASRYKYEAYREFQADDYLSKPLDLSSLRDLLRKHLGSPGGEHERTEP